MVISRTVNKVNVKELNDVYDIFIAGSDQVWNYKLTNSDSTYLLDFVKDNNKNLVMQQVLESVQLKMNKRRTTVNY